MNKRLSMDKGARQAFGAYPRQTGYKSVADYTHRPDEINEVAAHCAEKWTRFPCPDDEPLLEESAGSIPNVEPVGPGLQDFQSFPPWTHRGFLR
jgi:hypothetical protein